jgi:hypothetical protein
MAGLTPDSRAFYGLRELRKGACLALWRQKAHAEAGKRKRTAEREAERLTAQAKLDAEVELSLAPEKKRLQNQWLVNNLTRTPSDFEKKVWHLLKENLFEQRKNEAFEAELQSQRASGRYSL